MMTKILQDQVALISGGSRGIGAATAKRLAQSGCHVAINYLTNEASAREVAEACRGYGVKTWLVKADMAEEDDIADMIDFVGEQAGRIDIVISNAASGGYRNLVKATPKNFDTAMHTNARALVILAQHAERWMVGRSRRGKIVAISSHGSHRALPAYGLIGASKAALESLVRQLAYELGPKGVNVNCVLAGLVATDATRHVETFDTLFAENQAKMLLPGSEVLSAEHVAETIHFLSSPAADLIQGHTLVIDGGVSLHL